MTESEVVSRYHNLGSQTCKYNRGGGGGEWGEWREGRGTFAKLKEAVGKRAHQQNPRLGLG